MTYNGLIEILLVEDSELTRRIIKKCIDKNNQLTLLAAVNDPIEAAEFIKDKVPDIIILDIIMPKMTGIEFLEILMKQCPVPVIVFSSHTKNNSLLLSDFIPISISKVRPLILLRLVPPFSVIRRCNFCNLPLLLVS